MTVTGGKQRSQGPLSMKRELRDVLLQMGELERAIGEKETYIAALGREIAELTGLLAASGRRQARIRTRRP